MTTVPASGLADAAARGQQHPAPLCVAFPILDGETWTAGQVHLATLLGAVRDTYGDQQVRAIVFGPEPAEVAAEYARGIGAAGGLQYRLPRAGSAAWARNWLSRHLRQQDTSIQAVLESEGVSAVFCINLKMSYGRIGTLCWLPDFQHVALPDMFDPAARSARDAAFMCSTKLATRIVLTSEAVRRDFMAFAPRYADKARVLHPVCHVPQDIYRLDPALVVKLYDLPEKFIYLPNQFWKHKNHEVVLSAVKLLKERGMDVRVVCSGNLSDHRHPRYTTELFEKLSVWGLREHLICLGLVPREHLLLLMRQSVCVLNPSRFEGWGYTVDEARSLGKRVLASDIPAHREQDPPLAAFFDPGSVEELADRLRDVWLDGEPGPDPCREVVARQQWERRRRAYAEQFVALAREASHAARR